MSGVSRLSPSLVMLSVGAFVVCGRRHVGASAGSRPCLSRGAAQAWSPLGAHRGDALCPSSPRRPVTPSEGDRKSRRRVSVRLWLRVTSAPSPLPVSPLRIPSLFPFSDCKVGLFNLFLGPVGKDEKQSRRRGSKERRKVLPADCLQSGHTLVGVGARMNLSLSSKQVFNNGFTFIFSVLSSLLRAETSLASKGSTQDDPPSRGSGLGALWESWGQAGFSWGPARRGWRGCVPGLCPHVLLLPTPLS